MHWHIITLVLPQLSSVLINYIFSGSIDTIYIKPILKKAPKRMKRLPLMNTSKERKELTSEHCQEYQLRPSEKYKLAIYEELK